VGAASHGRRLNRLRAVVTNAEPLLKHQRETIERTFPYGVRETYGMVELVAGASECRHGGLHLWPEFGHIEILGPGGPREPIGAGELICTSLLDADMPLIRYQIGDRAAFPERSETCACGRGLPLLRAVEGRRDDVLQTIDGRPVGRLDPVFKCGLPIREAQIVQEKLERVRLRFVPGEAFRVADGDALVRALRERLGPVEVVLEPVAAIPRTSNGKFRAVISELSQQQRKAGMAA
jgi:phenylacetate-CoA ligase